MGCLFELFFEILVEGILELIGYCYIKLMTLIVPGKRISDGIKERIKAIVTVAAAVLGIVLIVGLLLFLQEDPDIKNIGRYMTWIPLAIMAFQIVSGIVIQMIGLFRK